MNPTIPTDNYDALIKTIRRKKRIIVVVTIVLSFVILMACSPIYITFLDKIVVDYRGVNPIVTVLLILLVFLAELFACALVYTPLTASMDVECDPQKHLALNSALNKPKNLDSICATDFTYLGNYQVALKYADKMVSSSNSRIVIVGLFNRARCQFFLGDFASLKITVGHYINNVAAAKLRPKDKAACEKMQKTLQLLVALAEDDKEQIAVYRDVEVWNASKATQGYIYYLKGIAAVRLDEKEEAIYRLMYVKENCEKTVFAGMAQQHLDALKVQ